MDGAWSKDSISTPNSTLIMFHLRFLILLAFAFSSIFNRTSQWASMCVLMAEKVKDRVKLFRRLLAVAEHLFKLKNFHSLLAILVGMTSVPVYRLRQTMEARRLLLLVCIFSYLSLF